MKKILLLLVLFSLLTLRAFSWEMLYSVEEIHTLLQKKVEEAAVIEQPFPHIVIENLFPDDFYQYAMSLWPSEDLFNNAACISADHDRIERSELSTNQKMFWPVFGDIIGDLKLTLIEKLRPYFKLKFGMQGFPVERLHPVKDFTNFGGLLIQYKPGFSISSHVDQFNIFAAVLIYFPADTDHTEAGTTLYSGSPNSNLYRIYNSQVNNLKFSKKISYKPNTLVCMLQTQSSWHSAENVYPNYLRRFFSSAIYLSSDFMNLHYSDIWKKELSD